MQLVFGLTLALSLGVEDAVEIGRYIAELTSSGAIGLHYRDNAAIVNSADLVDETASQAGAEAIDRLEMEEGVVALDAYDWAPRFLPRRNATCDGRAEARDQSASLAGTLC